MLGKGVISTDVVFQKNASPPPPGPRPFSYLNKPVAPMVKYVGTPEDPILPLVKHLGMPQGHVRSVVESWYSKVSTL